MYGLPAGFDGAFFIGRCLELVSFWANAVYISFDTNLEVDPKLSITVNSSFEHRLGPNVEQAQIQQVPDDPSMLMRTIGRGLVPGEAGYGVQQPPVDRSMLMRIIGHAVVKVEISRPGTLMLHFDDGQVLSMFDDLPNYECYSIEHGQDTIYI